MAQPIPLTQSFMNPQGFAGGMTSSPLTAPALPSMTAPVAAPFIGPVKPASTGTGLYSIAQGDTLSGIAAKNNMSLAQILQNNPQYAANPNMIKVGQSVNLMKAPTAAPVAPVKPVVSLQPHITTPSGATVSPSTGSVVAPPAPVAPAPVAPPAPATPVISDVQAADDAAAKAYQDAQQLTPEEIATQQSTNALEESYNSAYQNTGHQAIPLEFITGQQRALLESKTSLMAPLQARAALLQAKRTAAISASKFALDRADAAVTKQETVAKDEKAAALTAKNRTEDQKIAADKTAFDQEMATKTLKQRADESDRSFQQAQQKFEEDKREFGITNALNNRKVALEENKITAAANDTKKIAQSDAVNNYSLVDTLLNNGGLNAIAGGVKYPFGLIPPGTDAALASNQLKQIQGILSLENRSKLKGQGAISDFEGKTLAEAASAIGVDKYGKSNLSDKDLKAQLSKVKAVFATAAGMDADVQITDPSTGKSITGKSTRDQINAAIKAGARVEYK